MSSPGGQPGQPIRRRERQQAARRALLIGWPCFRTHKGPALDSLKQDHEKVREEAGFGRGAGRLKPLAGFVVHTDENTARFLPKGHAAHLLFLQARNQSLLDSQGDLLVAAKQQHGDKG